MEQYQRERARQKMISTVTGIVLTVAVHVFLAVFGVFTGLKYIYPPPEEKSILIDFTVEEQAPVKPRTGREPRAVNPDPSKPLELVQRSEAQNLGTKQNEAPEATVGPDGDVEVPEPPREKEIDRRALFHSADNKTDKDTLAAQTATKVTDALKAGHAQGTTDKGKEVGEPNAKLKGRNAVNGYLPKPEYKADKDGIVVVDIWVDNYGEVKKATINPDLTRVTDNTLWQAAINAAKKARFNMTMDAPPMQQGTITYKFTIKK
ncbi:MAG: energy transducer TonB [Bacteroidales bacterium]|nr:energy transducer TonB [Bacteroidales bacterium]